MRGTDTKGTLIVGAAALVQAHIECDIVVRSACVRWALELTRLFIRTNTRRQ